MENLLFLSAEVKWWMQSRQLNLGEVTFGRREKHRALGVWKLKNCDIKRALCDFTSQFNLSQKPTKFPFILSVPNFVAFLMLIASQPTLNSHYATELFKRRTRNGLIGHFFHLVIEKVREARLYPSEALAQCWPTIIKPGEHGQRSLTFFRLAFKPNSHKASADEIWTWKISLYSEHLILISILSPAATTIKHPRARHSL